MHKNRQCFTECTIISYYQCRLVSFMFSFIPKKAEMTSLLWQCSLPNPVDALLLIKPDYKFLQNSKGWKQLII